MTMSQSQAKILLANELTDKFVRFNLLFHETQQMVSNIEAFAQLCNMSLVQCTESDINSYDLKLADLVDKQQELEQLANEIKYFCDI